MSSRWAILVCVACGGAQGVGDGVASAPPVAHTEEGVTLVHAPDLLAVMSAPQRAPYLSDALGIGGESVSVKLTNRAEHAVPVEHVRLAFTATREGVSFSCKEHVGGSVSKREPASLAPGQSFVFERDLDCSMPIPGRYDVRADISFGVSDARDPLGRFSIEVVASTSPVPRPYPNHAGLFVLMTGSRVTRPLPPDAWSRGDYRVVVAAINGSAQPIALGHASLVFRTYKTGSSLACSGQTEPLAFPDQLAPGAVELRQVPVACAPSEEGHYDIFGDLALGDAKQGVEIGRVALKVTSDPLLFAPDPLLGDPAPLPR